MERAKVRRQDGSAMLANFFFMMAAWVIPLNRRRPRTQLDYGDRETIGCDLIRRDITPNYKQGDFGIFLGEHPSGWVVGIKNLKGTLYPDHFTGCVVYPTLNDVRKVWMAQ